MINDRLWIILSDDALRFLLRLHGRCPWLEDVPRTRKLAGVDNIDTDTTQLVCERAVQTGACAASCFRKRWAIS